MYWDILTIWYRSDLKLPNWTSLHGNTFCSLVQSLWLKCLIFVVHVAIIRGDQYGWSVCRLKVPFTFQGGTIFLIWNMFKDICFQVIRLHVCHLLSAYPNTPSLSALVPLLLPTPHPYSPCQWPPALKSRLDLMFSSLEGNSISQPISWQNISSTPAPGILGEERLDKITFPPSMHLQSSWREKSCSSGKVSRET